MSEVYSAKATISFTTDMYNISLLAAMYEILAYDTVTPGNKEEVSFQTQENIGGILDVIVDFLRVYYIEDLDTKHLRAKAEWLLEIVDKIESNA